MDIQRMRRMAPQPIDFHGWWQSEPRPSILRNVDAFVRSFLDCHCGYDDETGAPKVNGFKCLLLGH